MSGRLGLFCVINSYYFFIIVGKIEGRWYSLVKSRFLLGLYFFFEFFNRLGLICVFFFVFRCYLLIFIYLNVLGFYFMLGCVWCCEDIVESVFGFYRILYFKEKD